MLIHNLVILTVQQSLPTSTFKSMKWFTFKVRTFFKIDTYICSLPFKNDIKREFQKTKTKNKTKQKKRKPS